MNDVIISGLKTTHKTYARAVNNDDQDYQDAPEMEITTLENQVVAFIQNKLEVEIEPNKIEACHTLKGKKEVPDIIVRVTNRTLLMRNAKKLRGTRTFMNEHLTKSNAAISKIARQLRKSGQIMNTWTRNCKVFIKMLTGQVTAIKNMDGFHKLGLNPG